MRMRRGCNLLLQVNLIEASAIGKVVLVRLGPAAEALLDGEQVELGQLLDVQGLHEFFGFGIALSLAPALRLAKSHAAR